MEENKKVDEVRNEIVDLEEDELINRVGKFKLINTLKEEVIDYRYLFSPAPLLAEEVTDKVRREDEENINKENDRCRKASRFPFNMFSFYIRTPYKPDEYWNGFKYGFEYSRQYFNKIHVGESISREKLERIIKFLIDEGVTICNSATGITFIEGKHTGEKYFKWEIDYKMDKEDSLA